MCWERRISKERKAVGPNGIKGGPGLSFGPVLGEPEDKKAS